MWGRDTSSNGWFSICHVSFPESMYNSFHISCKYSTTLSNTTRTGPGLSDWVFLMPPMCGLKFRQERIQVEIILTWPINGSNKARGSL